MGEAPLADAFYHTESLKAVTLFTEPYTANTDAKDAAYGNESGIEISDKGTTLSMPLQRPFAKYRIIVDADEIAEYLKMRKVNPQEFPPIEELTVSVQYEGYFPSGFNVSTEKPNDAVVGITYSGSLSRYDGSAAELELGSDWILVNGNTSFVNATNLKSVVLQDAATEVEAFYAKQGITVTDGGTVNVTLSRAVAKVALNETDRLVAGSITVTYNGFKDFNVSTGNGINSGTLTKTISFANVIEGTVANPTKVGEFLLLANSGESYLSDFRVQYNSEAEKSITNVPVQANYVTNINGKFSVNVSQSFSISINDTWSDTSKEVGI